MKGVFIGIISEKAIFIRYRFFKIRFSDFYRPQTKLRKGNVFTSVSRILSTGGCTLPLGRHTPPAETPLLGRHPPRQTATAADGTYHTGMHSCLSCKLSEIHVSRLQQGCDYAEEGIRFSLTHESFELPLLISSTP